MRGRKNDLHNEQTEKHRKQDRNKPDGYMEEASYRMMPSRWGF